MSTKVIKYISVCLLVLAFGAFGTGIAKATLTANATALTSDGVLTITGADVSVWSVASVATGDNLTVGVTGATDSSLILSSTGTGAAALQITTTAGGLDISVTGTAAGEDLDITTVGDATELRITSASNQADAILLNASNAAGGIDINFGTGNLDIDGTGVSADITIDGDLFSIDGTGVSNVTVTSTAVDEDFTVSLAGAFDASLILSSTGTGADALQITTTAGGLDISVTGTAAGEDLDITTVGDTTEIRISSASLEDDAITISATAATGGVYILAGNGEVAAIGTDDSIELRATVDTIVALTAGGSLVIDGATTDQANTSGALDIDVDTITASGIGVSVDFQVGDAAASNTYYSVKNDVTIDLDAVSTPTVYGNYIGLTVNEDTAVTYGLAIVALDASTDVVTAGLLIENLQATDIDLTDAILIRSTTNAAIATALNVSDAEITTALNVGANAIEATELDFNIAPTAGTSSIAITASADAEDFLIDLIGAFNTTLTLRSAGNAANAMELTTSAGGLDISVTGDLDGEDLDITAVGAATEIRIATASTVADAFRLNASAGGIDIDATNSTLNITNTGDGAGDDLTIAAAGAFDVNLILSSAGTAADALQITTTAGGLDISVTGTADTEDLDITAVGATTEIRVATASTTADAFRLNASAGGIDIDATNSTLRISNTADGAADDLILDVIGAQDASIVLNSAGTGADAIDVNATGTAGGMTFNTTDGAIAITAAGAANGDLTITVGDDFTLTGVATSVITIGDTTSGLRYYEDIEEGAGDITATAAMSGRTFYLGTAAKDVTLPDASAASGVWYQFVVSANVATNNMTVTGPAADATDDEIYGTVTVAGVVTLCAAEDTLTFVAETNEAIQGDWIELRSDGTNWYLSGQVATASAFTCTDAD